MHTLSPTAARARIIRAVIISHFLTTVSITADFFTNRGLETARFKFWLTTGVLFPAASPVRAQTINRHEGILIDVSGSIGKGGTNNELFREYLFSVKKLLLTEPPNSRVWVSVITTESFGSMRSLVKGWTPDAQGLFTDDLDRARHQLAANFEAKSAVLRHSGRNRHNRGPLELKALLESGSKGNSDASLKNHLDLVGHDE